MKFDISTEKGIRAAENYQSKLYRKFDGVITRYIGHDAITITGRNSHLGRQNRCYCGYCENEPRIKRTTIK